MRSDGFLRRRPWPAPWLDWSGEDWTFFATLPVRAVLALGVLAGMVVYRVAVGLWRAWGIFLAGLEAR